MKKMLQKIFSILLAACFVLSVVPAPAAAAGNDVTNGEYNAEGVWAPSNPSSKSYTVDGAEVTLSKTATAIGNNEFRIDLQVKTSTTTSTFTAGDAVVLVMDVSGSMAYCADCGNENRHESDCPRNEPYEDWWGREQNSEVEEDDSRMVAAQNAAASFLAAYAGTDASASRMLAIVSFQSSAKTRLDWVNVAGGAGKNSYDQARNTIYSLSADGGTNLDDGLSHALTLLNKDTVKNAASKNVIALTDGAPTKSQHYGNGTSGSADINRETATQAANVRGTGATLHTVCFGVANESTYWGGITVGEFLRESVATSGKAHNADNTAELNQAFAAITESITSGLSGSGLTVTDPMAPMISVTGGTGEHFSSPDNKTFTWKLTTDDVTENGNVTTYVYKYSYTVKLDVQDPDFKEGEFYPTNERTYLNVDDDTKLEFPVPGVQGVLPRTSVTVTKAWSDADNQDDLRPESVTVQLTKDGTPIGEKVVLNDSNGWTKTWTDQIAMSGGVTHVYSVIEEDIKDEEGNVVYTPSVTTKDNQYDLILTNTHAPEKTSVKVTKNWDDNENQDGKRPASIQVQLYADGTIKGEPVTLNEANGWSYTWTELDKNKAGVAINYTVGEVGLPEGYTGGTPIGSIAEGFTITNSYTPETTKVEGSKTWDDDNNRDQVRPESITINLLADKKEIKEVKVTPDEAGNWTWSFTGLPKYRDGGVEIVYEITEDKVDGYDTIVNGYNVTNTHEIEKTSVTVTKIWDDNNNQDGKREDILIQLYADGEECGAPITLSAKDNELIYTWKELPKFNQGVAIEYTVKELTAIEDYDKPIYGGSDGELTITNKHTPETITISGTKTWKDADDQDGIRPDEIQLKLLADGAEIASVTVKASDDWKYSISNLPKYAAGEEIEYTVEEVTVNGYDTKVDGYDITNTHTPATTKVTVVKNWDDESNLEGFRPENITIQLNANDVPVGESVTFSGEGDTWTYEFVDLPKYADQGKEIIYTVTEKEDSNYKSSISEIENGTITITNSREVELIDISVTKEWEDDSDRDGLRPDDIKLTLLANGVAVQEDVSVTGEGNTWTYTFSELPKYANGEEIVYSVTEDAVAEYETEISEIKDGKITITNTHDPKLIDVSVTKVWDDADNQDGKRPSNVEVVLYSNGEPTKYSHKLSGKYETDFYTFKDLYAFEGGEPVVYTVVEKEVPAGYESNTTGSMTDGFTITNTHVPEMIDEIKVTKVWIDAEDQDGKRPASITINLLADKEKVADIVLNDENGWSGSFNELPMYKDSKEIKYSVEEVKVDGYKSKISGSVEEGFTVTNTHEVEKIDEIEVTKVWDDADDQDGIRPEKITVNLLANGKIVASAELKATLRTIFTGDWTATFKDLDKYENGEEIVYTITENAVSGYETKITGSVENGFTVTNTHEPEMTKLDVQKFWKDDNNKEKTRADSVKITLYANGKSTGKTVTLNEKNQWFDSFENLPKYDNGKEIKYTVKEASLALYKASYSYNGTKAVVTNTLSEVPNTGDTSNVGLYLGLMGVCAVAAVALILLNKKKRNA